MLKGDPKVEIIIPNPPLIPLITCCIVDTQIDPKEDKRQDIEGIENSNSVDIFNEKVPKT